MQDITLSDILRRFISVFLPGAKMMIEPYSYVRGIYSKIIKNGVEIHMVLVPVFFKTRGVKIIGDEKPEVGDLVSAMLDEDGFLRIRVESINQLYSISDPEERQKHFEAKIQEQNDADYLPDHFHTVP